MRCLRRRPTPIYLDAPERPVPVALATMPLAALLGAVAALVATDHMGEGGYLAMLGIGAWCGWVLWLGRDR